MVRPTQPKHRHSRVAIRAKTGVRQSKPTSTSKFKPKQRNNKPRPVRAVLPPPRLCEGIPSIRDATHVLYPSLARVLFSGIDNENVVGAADLRKPRQIWIFPATENQQALKCDGCAWSRHLQYNFLCSATNKKAQLRHVGTMKRVHQLAKKHTVLVTLDGSHLEGKVVLGDEEPRSARSKYYQSTLKITSK